METPELTAFRDECAATDATLGTVPAEAWARRALGSWTLAELVAHLLGAVSRLTAYVDTPVEGDTPALDRVAYFRALRPTDAPMIAQRAVAGARGVDAETLPALFTEAWRDDADLAATLPPERVLATRLGPARADEYLATRVLEVTVHHLDVRAALDLPPAPSPTGGALTMHLLEGLLAGPRPRNLGRVRFIQAATGRIPSDDPRFPLVS